ncbi:MAG: hypothetical protein ABSG68_20915, partial [Thermoguttaceae bacterium]
QKLDALYGKLDQLAAAAPRAVAAGAEAGIGEAALKGAVKPLGERLEQLDAKLKALVERTTAIDALKEAFVPTLVKVRDGLGEQHVALGNGIRQIQQRVDVLPQYFDALQQHMAALQQHVDGGLQHLFAQLRPPEPEPSGGLTLSGDWQQAILGADLADDARLDRQRQQLLGDFLAHEPSASALVGNLLVFRASAPEKMPTLLKDIGEAYYRWQPKTTDAADALESALVQCLGRACDAAGISNIIEVVHPGERFDSTRHTAAERGVEITHVFGWVVLRDNGKVYTKAAVAVK